MSFQKGQWMFNKVGSEIWHGDYFDTKEEAIEAAKEEYEDIYDSFVVGQIEPAHISVDVNVDSILENINAVAFDVVGEVADDYLNDVTKEHRSILEKRLSVVLKEWMGEFNYYPQFFHIINTEEIEI